MILMCEAGDGSQDALQSMQGIFYFITKVYDEGGSRERGYMYTYE